MIILFIIYVALSASGLFLMKIGSEGASVAVVKHILKIDVNLVLLLGMLCYIASFLLFIFIISKNDISYIYPISAGVLNIITFFLGVAVLKEKADVPSVIGIVLITAGVVLINIK